MAILSIHGVRSYQGEKPVEFDLSKYVNLIYGQNGSEKSTVSGYFYKHGRPDYSRCSLQPPLDMNYLVFNQQYVDDIFSQPSQPGIFTLHSENAEIKTEIDDLEAESKVFSPGVMLWTCKNAALMVWKKTLKMVLRDIFMGFDGWNHDLTQ